MSKKPHHLQNLSDIMATLTPEPAKTISPSPAPPRAAVKVEAEQPLPYPAGQRGRPATGKKSNQDYCQTTISIRKTTHKRMKRALLDLDNGQDFSDVVEELLGKWLDAKI